MSICYPSDTQWGCAYSEEQLATMRADPVALAVMQRSEAFAWSTLAALTAYRIGTCPVVVRPCAQRCAPQGTWMEAIVTAGNTIPPVTIGRSFTPHIEGGEWVNSCGCGGSDSCSCSALSEVILPGPVGDVVEVVVDGVVVDPRAYRVDNGNRLVRQDGGTWPVCQDMSTPTAAPPVVEPFEMTLSNGSAILLSREGDMVTAQVTLVSGSDSTPPPELPAAFQPVRGTEYSGFSAEPAGSAGSFRLGAFNTAAGSWLEVSTFGAGPWGTATFRWLADPLPFQDQKGVFTVEYYRGAAPNEITRYAAGVLAAEFYKGCTDGKCRLPRGTTSVQRRGVSYELETNFMDTLASWPEIAPVIAMFNPNRLKSAPRVLSPDSRNRVRQQTWGHR